jgi:hypothetical protein
MPLTTWTFLLHDDNLVRCYLTTRNLLFLEGLAPLQVKVSSPARFISVVLRLKDRVPVALVSCSCSLHHLDERGFWLEEHRNQSLHDTVRLLDDPEIAEGVYSVEALAPRSRRRREHTWHPDEPHPATLPRLVNEQAPEPLLAVVAGELVGLQG